MKIGILGTGNVAQNLGNLFINNGFDVMFGGRNPAENLTGKKVESFTVTAKNAEVVIFAVPYEAFREVAETLQDALAGKIVIDLTNPLNADWSPLNLGAENSAGEENAKLLPNSRFVKAFNTVFADVMKTEKQVFNGQKLTVFIAGEDPEANKTVADLAEKIGFSATITGGIKNARYLEAIAHLNIQIAVGMQGGTEAGFTYFQR